jgi:hypothetical protein
MRVKLDIPDDLWERFASPGMSYDEVKATIVSNLQTFSKYPITNRALVFSLDELAEIQTLLNSAVTSPRELIKAVGALITCSMEGVQVKFDPMQLETMREQAQFMGRTLPEYIAEQVQYGISVAQGSN